jgi:iron complex outermembrane receptor protein
VAGVKTYNINLNSRGSKQMKKPFIKAFFVALGFIFILSPSVFAQDETEDEFVLEEITVTAQKREQNQQKVPISMDSISGETLALEGKNDVDDILSGLSNVTINTMSDGMRISIRGLTDTSNLDGGTNFKSTGSMVGVNIDGAQNNMSSAGQNLFDVERVEVLYGPQSTLYGSNSPGGIVNVVTAAPKTDKYSASFGANYGSYNYLNLQAVLNAPVVQDKVALRLAANNTDQDAYVEGASGTESTAVRLKALWQANDDLAITVTPSWSKTGSGGMMSGNVEPFRYQDGTYSDGTKVTDPWTPSSAEFDSALTGKGSSDRITKGLTSDINWNASFGTVSFVPSYSKSSSDSIQTDMDGDVFEMTQSSKETAAELRITNPQDFELFEWILGATYDKNDQNNDQNYQDANITDSYFYRKATKKALYGNITYPLAFYEELAVNFGYRQGWDTVDARGAASPGSSDIAVTSFTFSKPDVKIGFDWDTAENLMIYGSFANSYRSGSTNAEEAEKLAAYTVGAKTRFFNNKLQLNGSIYYYNYENKTQRTERQFEYVSEAEYFGYDYNEDGAVDDTEIELVGEGSEILGKFRNIGVDLSATWIITNTDRFDFSVSYLNGEWSDLTRPADDYYPDIWPEVKYEGNMTDNSPELSITGAYDHNFILGAWGTLTASIDGQYKSSFELMFDPGGDDNSGYNYQESYFLWNASATFNSPSGKWSLNASVKNITDYAVKRSYTAQGPNYMMMLGDPRTYQVGLNVKF